MKKALTFLFVIMATFAMPNFTNDEDSTVVDLSVDADDLLSNSQDATFIGDDQYDYRFHYCGAQDDRHPSDITSSRHGSDYGADYIITNIADRASIESRN